MGDVADRIVDLAAIERTPGPIGESRALVEASAKQGLDEILVADLFAEPERHRRDLGIEQGVGGPARQIEDDLDVLAAGVEDLEHMLVVHEQVEQGGKIDPVRLGVDRRGLLAIGHLEQADVRPVGILAHELGIDRDEVGSGEAFTEFFEGLGVGDQSVDMHLAALIEPDRWRWKRPSFDRGHERAAPGRNATGIWLSRATWPPIVEDQGGVTA